MCRTIPGMSSPDIFGRLVYGFGLDAQLIQKNLVGRFRYKVAKDKRPISADEHRMEEFGLLLEALPINRKGTWRAHVIFGVCGYQGARQWAVLHLKWSDVDWESDRIIWQAAWDKNGVEWDQPLRGPTRALLEWRRTGTAGWGSTRRGCSPPLGRPGKFTASRCCGGTCGPPSGGRGSSTGAAGRAWAPALAGRRGERAHRRRHAGHALHRGPGHPAGQPLPQEAGHTGTRGVRRAGRAIVEQSSGRRGGKRRGRRSGPCRGRTYGTPEEGLEPPTR